MNVQQIVQHLPDGFDPVASAHGDAIFIGDYVVYFEKGVPYLYRVPVKIILADDTDRGIADALVRDFNGFVRRMRSSGDNDLNDIQVK